MVDLKEVYLMLCEASRISGGLQWCATTVLQLVPQVYCSNSHKRHDLGPEAILFWD